MWTINPFDEGTRPSRKHYWSIIHRPWMGQGAPFLAIYNPKLPKKKRKTSTETTLQPQPPSLGTNYFKLVRMGWILRYEEKGYVHRVYVETRFAVIWLPESKTQQGRKRKNKKFCLFFSRCWKRELSRRKIWRGRERWTLCAIKDEGKCRWGEGKTPVSTAINRAINRLLLL